PSGGLMSNPDSLSISPVVLESPRAVAPATPRKVTMPRFSRLRARGYRLAASAVALTAVVLTGCAGGPSDSIDGSVADGSGGRIDLYAYSAVKPGVEAVVDEFNKTEAGEGVQVRQSYGASGDQSRKVADGAAADLVAFSLAPGITRLVDAGLVDADWNAGATKGVPFGSVVV